MRDIIEAAVAGTLRGKEWKGEEETVWTVGISEQIKRAVKGALAAAIAEPSSVRPPAAIIKRYNEKPSAHAPAELKYARYKFVVQVILGENKSQGVRVASRCLWDPETDNYATFSFKNVRPRPPRSRNILAPCRSARHSMRPPPASFCTRPFFCSLIAGFIVVHCHGICNVHRVIKVCFCIIFVNVYIHALIIKCTTSIICCDSGLGGVVAHTLRRTEDLQGSLHMFEALDQLSHRSSPLNVVATAAARILPRLPFHHFGKKDSKGSKQDEWQRKDVACMSEGARSAIRWSVVIF